MCINNYLRGQMLNVWLKHENTFSSIFYKRTRHTPFSVCIKSNAFWSTFSAGLFSFYWNSF